MTDEQIQDLLRVKRFELLEVCAQLAENTEHPHAASWEGDQRMRFYQRHILSAWRQAGAEIARRIRALADGASTNSEEEQP